MMHLLLILAACCVAFPLALLVTVLFTASLTKCAVEWALFKCSRTVRALCLRVFMVKKSPAVLVFAVCLAASNCLPSARAAGAEFPGGHTLATAVADDDAGKAVRVFFYLAGGVGGLAVAWTQLFRRRPSLDAELANFATQDDIVAVRAEMHATERRIEDKMQSHFTELDRKRSVSIAQLHTRITSTSDTLRAEIADIPADVIKLLKDTGNMGRAK